MKRTDITYDYEKLKERIRDYRYSQTAIAKEVSMSRTAFNQKINNKATFSQTDIRLLAKVLEISKDQYGEYFFSVVVRKNVQKIKQAS